MFHVTGDEDGGVPVPPTGVQAPGTADGDGQGADGDQDAAAADGVQAEGLSNGDFQFPVLISDLLVGSGSVFLVRFKISLV